MAHRTQPEEKVTNGQKMGLTPVSPACPSRDGKVAPNGPSRGLDPRAMRDGSGPNRKGVLHGRWPQHSQAGPCHCTVSSV